MNLDIGKDVLKITPQTAQDYVYLERFKGCHVAVIDEDFGDKWDSKDQKYRVKDGIYYPVGSIVLEVKKK